MYNFFIQAYLNYKGLFYWLNWPGYISSIIVSPVITVLLYFILGKFLQNPEAAQYYALGTAVSSITFVVIGGVSQTYSYDRRFYTLSYVFVSKVNRFLHFSSRVIFHYPNALVAFLAGILTLWVMIGFTNSNVNWPGLITAVLIVSASICAFAQFLSIFNIITRDWMNTLSLSTGVLLIFTGMVVPVELFPPAVQEFAKILPITNGMAAIRAAFSGGAFSDFGYQLLREALTGMVYFLIGGMSFVLLEKAAKKSGVLETET